MSDIFNHNSRWLTLDMSEFTGIVSLVTNPSSKQVSINLLHKNGNQFAFPLGEGEDAKAAAKQITNIIASRDKRNDVITYVHKTDITVLDMTGIELIKGILVDDNQEVVKYAFMVKPKSGDAYPIIFDTRKEAEEFMEVIMKYYKVSRPVTPEAESTKRVVRMVDETEKDIPSI